MPDNGIYIDSRVMRKDSFERSLSFEDVNSQIRLDPKNGFLYRRKNNKRTGLPKKAKYAAVGLNGKSIAAHRIVWLLTHGSWPSGFVDHINRDRYDNRPSNLRVVTHSENQSNRNKTKGKTFIGITRRAYCGKWAASIQRGNDRVYLGMFDTEIDAARAYDDAAFASGQNIGSLNFPQDDRWNAVGDLARDLVHEMAARRASK